MLASKYYSELETKGVTILTVELYNDLGQSGPNLAQFANQYGAGLNEQGWYYGYSNQTTTFTFDPKAALDVYYALNPQGVIVTRGNRTTQRSPIAGCGYFLVRKLNQQVDPMMAIY